MRLQWIGIAGLFLASEGWAAEPSTLEKAYFKELSFLKAQKAEMETRAQVGEREGERQLSQAKAEVEAKSTRLLELRRRSEALEEQLREATPAGRDKAEFVWDTVSRANDLFAEEPPRISVPAKDPAPNPAALAELITTTFTEIEKEVRLGHQVRTAPGSFFDAEGGKQEGQLVHVGRVAAFGVAGPVAGALAPAGEGQLKLVPIAADETARALASGQTPQVFAVFLADAFDTLVLDGKDTELSKEIQAAQAGANMKNNGIVETLMGLPIFHAEWVLYLLIVMSVVSVGVMIERALFFRRHRIDIDTVRSQLKTHLVRGDFHGAAELLSGYDSLETNVVLCGLREHDTGPDSVEDLIRGAEAKEKLRYNKWLSFLATVGSNSPFIGLFGTVLGIIRAFADLGADMGGAGGSVMAGISEALIATAVGLLVAIPAVIAYNAFSGRVKTVVANSELLSRTLLSALKAHETAAPRLGVN